MSYQFLCPHGHLLEAEPEEQGETAQCPFCGCLFVIPPPVTGGSACHPVGTAGTLPSADQGALPQAQQTSPLGRVEDESPPRWADRPPQLGGNEPPAEHPHLDAHYPETDRSSQDRSATAPVIERADELARIESLPLYHIRCPNGHELETPREMLGQEALCPFCRAQFVLRMEESREYMAYKAAEEARRQERLGKLWLRWAIAAAVVVVLMMVVLIVLAAV